MKTRVAAVARGLQQLRRSLDRQVIGHEPVKSALILGLVARENVYLEGPSGIAKTMLGEILADATGMQKWYTQMHRDTRVSELIGDAVIIRQQVGKNREILSHAHEPGGVLTCEVALLDDITNCPGEAINVRGKLIYCAYLLLPALIKGAAACAERKKVQKRANPSAHSNCNW